MFDEQEERPDSMRVRKLKEMIAELQLMVDEAAPEAEAPAPELDPSALSEKPL